MQSDAVKEALRELADCLKDYKVPSHSPAEIVETDEGTSGVLDMPEGSIESPGGSTVTTLPLNICEKVNVGSVLTASEFVRFMTAYRSTRDRFIGSKMFNGFAGPWESVLRSLLDDPVITTIVRKGLAIDAYEMVNKLRARFSMELGSVLAHSNIFKKRFMMIFSRTPSMDSLMHAIKNGSFDGIAQSEAFIVRVKLIKELIDRSLIKAEKHGVFLPMYITAAQRGLPIRGSAPLGVNGLGMTSMPSPIANRLYPSGSMMSGASAVSESLQRRQVRKVHW